MFVGTRYYPREKLWKGPEWSPLFGTKVSLGQVLMNSMMRNRDFVGQICYDDGSEMKNSEILQNSIRVALHLKDLGLREGSVIGVAAKNSKFLSAVAIGALAMGFPISTLDWTFEKDDIVHIFRTTQPEVVFCDQYNCKEVKKALMELSSKAIVYILFGDANSNSGVKTVSELLEKHPEEDTFAPPSINDSTVLPAIIICSSGTTGPPKGVTLTHASLAYQILDVFCDDSGGKFLCFSSLYWMTGVATLLMTTYQHITRVITTQPFSPELLIRIVKEQKINSMITPPTQLALTLRNPDLRSSDLDSLTTWWCGGGHVPVENCIKADQLMKNGHPVIGYGCSEISGLATKSIDLSFDHVGDLVRGTTLSVIDSEGNRLGLGERGEICLKPAVPIRGYYKNVEATNNSLVDGWFQTGDIGFMDAAGRLHIVDRKKDIMKVNNYHINPSELESVIQKIPEVVLVSVFALPDPVYTDSPAAMIVKAPDSKLTGAEVEEMMHEHLPSYKWLKGGVHFVEEMPLTASGKILRRKCREMVMNQGENR